MLMRSAASLAAGLLIAAAATPAWAQPACANRDQVLDRFQAKFAEKPAALGVVSEDSVLEVLISEKGTWTIIITGSDGASCPVASGIAWENLEAHAGGSKATQAPGETGRVSPQLLAGIENSE